MRKALPIAALAAAGAIAWALWPTGAPAPLDSRTVGAAAETTYVVVYQPPSLSEIQDLVDPDVPLTSTPAAAWSRLRWQPAEPVLAADGSTTGGGSATTQVVVDEAPVPAPQTGPQSPEEVDDPHKVFDGSEGAPDPALAQADDPHKVYDGHEVHADDPFKVFDDPLTLDPVATTADGEVGPSDSELENHVAGRVLDTQTPPASLAEAHVDGRRLAEAGLSPTESGRWAPPDLTNTTLAQPPKVDPAMVALMAETLTEPEPVPTWDGPGTDTRQP